MYITHHLIGHHVNDITAECDAFVFLHCQKLRIIQDHWTTWGKNQHRVNFLNPEKKSLGYLYQYLLGIIWLTHWGQVTHICISNLSIIGSDNGLSPGRCQAIIWTNAGILLIGPLGKNFNEILNEIHTFLFKKMHLKMSSGKGRSFCLGINVLISLLRPCDTYICMETGL